MRHLRGVRSPSSLVVFKARSLHYSSARVVLFFTSMVLSELGKERAHAQKPIKEHRGSAPSYWYQLWSPLWFHCAFDFTPPCPTLCKSSALGKESERFSWMHDVQVQGNKHRNPIWTDSRAWAPFSVVSRCQRMLNPGQQDLPPNIFFIHIPPKRWTANNRFCCCEANSSCTHHHACTCVHVPSERISTG